MRTPRSLLTFSFQQFVCMSYSLASFNLFLAFSSANTRKLLQSFYLLFWLFTEYHWWNNTQCISTQPMRDELFFSLVAQGNPSAHHHGYHSGQVILHRGDCFQNWSGLGRVHQPHTEGFKEGSSVIFGNCQDNWECFDHRWVQESCKGKDAMAPYLSNTNVIMLFLVFDNCRVIIDFLWASDAPSPSRVLMHNTTAW